MNESAANDTPLFLQLLVFTDCVDYKPLSLQLDRLPIDCLLFKDLRDPQGIGLLAFSDDPEHIASDLRDMLSSRLFRAFMLRHELTMTARTFGDIARAREELEAATRNREWPWAIWHPIKGTAALAALDEKLHAAAFGRMVDVTGLGPSDFGRVLLKGHGLDGHGNDFVQGFFGRHLHQLSAIIESTQRSPLHGELVSASGPYFVGRSLAAGDAPAAQARW
jgi:hypothetical protein